MIKSGTLYGVGVGPGDPELITLKAVRIIEEADVIALPKTDEQYITSLDIVKKAVDISNKEIIELYLPMTRDKEILRLSHEKAGSQLAALLQIGKNIAFLTLGDPSIYSTYIYIHNWLSQAGFSVQLIPGVPSFCAVAAKLNTSLCKGSELLHIIPASYEDTEDYLAWRGTKILMKSGKSLHKVVESLHNKNLTSQAAMVERCGMEGERVYNNLAGVTLDSGYFTTIVVKDKETES